jgi:ArsR family transcriptional regulator
MKSSKFSPADSVAFAKVLADPTRQQIMEFCCCEWQSVTQIVDSVNVSQPTVSHHLSVLKEAGLVEAKDEGKHTFYTLNQERVAFCCGQLISVFAPETKTAEKLVGLSAVK